MSKLRVLWHVLDIHTVLCQCGAQHQLIFVTHRHLHRMFCQRLMWFKQPEMLSVSSENCSASLLEEGANTKYAKCQRTPLHFLLLFFLLLLLHSIKCSTYMWYYVVFVWVLYIVALWKPAGFSPPRYDIRIYPTFLHLHGKTFDYKIPYTTVLRLFLLPHKDQRQMFFVVSLSGLRSGPQITRSQMMDSICEHFFKRAKVNLWTSP